MPETGHSGRVAVVESLVITVETGHRRGVFDLTGEAARFVAGKGDGLLSVFVPHATAGIAIIETGAGSDDDLMDRIDALLPRDDTHYRHRHGSPGHGADHVLPGFVAPSITIPVLGGEIGFGTWQSLVLVDPNEDNPTRKVRFSFLSA
jgi:secondary thiamine-phosphate synthase enzyme